MSVWIPRTWCLPFVSWFNSFFVFNLLITRVRIHSTASAPGCKCVSQGGPPPAKFSSSGNQVSSYDISADCAWGLFTATMCLSALSSLYLSIFPGISVHLGHYPSHIEVENRQMAVQNLEGLQFSRAKGLSLLWERRSEPWRRKKSCQARKEHLFS